MRKTRSNSACALVAVLILLSGCKEKVPEEAKAMLATITLSAKERASAFAVIRPRLVAAKAEDRAALQKLVTAHGNGLNAVAAAFSDLNESIKKSGGILSEKACAMIKAEALTSKARADNFRGVRSFIAQNKDVDPWLDDHQAALDAQASAIEKAAKLLEKQKPKAPSQSILKYASENGITEQIAKDAGAGSLEEYVRDYARSHGPALK